MAFLEWNDGYSVNVERIDRQHRRLFELINQLHETMNEDEDRGAGAYLVRELDTMAKVLDELVDYASYHLSTEEKYMLEYEYPDYAKHKEVHGQFLKKAQALKGDFDNGRAVFPEEILEFLKDWWSNHVLTVDRKYSTFFNAKGLT